MTKKKITVAVSGLNNTDNPGPGIPVVRGIRESKEFDARIIGFAYENLEPGIYLHDIIDKTYQIPYPSAGIEPLMQRLEYINSIEKIDVIIPNFDAELFSFMKCADDLKKMNIHTFLPTHEQFEERQKSNLPDFGKKYGVNVPFSRPIFGENEIFGLTADFTYPLLVKGKYYDAYPSRNLPKYGILKVIDNKKYFLTPDTYNLEPDIYPCLCLCLGFLRQTTLKTPSRFTTLQSLHIFFTDALTFIYSTSSLSYRLTLLSMKTTACKKFCLWLSRGVKIPSALYHPEVYECETSWFCQKVRQELHSRLQVPHEKARPAGLPSQRHLLHHLIQQSLFVMNDH